MQELIEKLAMKSGDSFYALAFYHDNDKIIKEALEKEKEQIKDAFEIGISEGLSMENNTLGYDANPEEYYNQTYNQEPKKEYQPSEEYLKKQRELMEDFVWNKMNNNNNEKD